MSSDLGQLIKANTVTKLNVKEGSKLIQSCPDQLVVDSKASGAQGPSGAIQANLICVQSYYSTSYTYRVGEYMFDQTQGVIHRYNTDGTHAGSSLWTSTKPTTITELEGFTYTNDIPCNLGVVIGDGEYMLQAEYDPAATPGQVIKEGDARLTDARTPLAHTHVISDITGLQSYVDLTNSALQPGANISVLTNDLGFIDSSGAPVQSVNGFTGIVVLNKSSIGLGNVDNTSDIDKPISNSTQTALNAYQPNPSYCFSGVLRRAK